MKTKKEIASRVITIQKGTRREIGMYQISLNGVYVCNWQSQHYAAVVSFPEGQYDTPLTGYEKNGKMLTAKTKKEFVDAVHFVLYNENN